VSWWAAGLLNVIVTAVAGGGLVGLATLRAQRRKVGADADVGMATAAETLTGAALLMVQQAATRANEAERKADHAEQEAAEAHALVLLTQRRLSRLVGWIRTQGMDPPLWVLDED
jgi:hypothetical protein